MRGLPFRTLTRSEGAVIAEGNGRSTLQGAPNALLPEVALHG
jgi:hypothetical protein